MEFLKAASAGVAHKIPVYAPLFKINTNSKIYKWVLEIVSDGDGFKIVTRNGEEGGKMIEHTTLITKGKASRTPLEQAVLEANAKFKNKKEKELYVEDMSSLTKELDVSKKSGGKKAVSAAKVRPMLAQEFTFAKYDKAAASSRSFKINFPAFVQKKYDGIRCLAYMRDGKVFLESRTGEKFEKFDLLRGQLEAAFFNKMSPEQQATFYFDGELYTDDIPFNEISGLVRMTSKHAKAADMERADKIHYYVYDCIDLANLEMTYKDRNQLLAATFKANKSPMLHLVETEIAESTKDVKEKHDQYVAEGYEGIMVRDMMGPYEVDKRSKYLQKYKEFCEDEFKIIGFHEENGGLVIWDVLLPNGKTCAAAPNASDAQRKDLFKNGNSYIGKMLTIYHFGYDADGRLRFPRGKAIREGY
jgi:ATP-dependent DNA ligase